MRRNMNNIKFNYDEIVGYAMYDIKSGKLIAGYNFENAEEDNMSEYKYKLEDFEEGNVYEDTQGFQFKLDKYGRLLVMDLDGAFKQMPFYTKMLEEKYKLIKLKLTIPKETAEFFKFLPNECKWLAKDADGKIYGYKEKPQCYGGYWGGSKFIRLDKFNIDTSFISAEDEPINFRKYIKELESEEK